MSIRDLQAHLRQLAEPGRPSQATGALQQGAHERYDVEQAAEAALVGVEYRHRSRDAWAVVLPDASADGKWRYQMWDRDGMLGHRTRVSRQDALQAMLEDGFTLPEPGVLDELEKTPRWQRGVELIDLNQRYLSGQLSFEEMASRRRQIAAQWATALQSHDSSDLPRSEQSDPAAAEDFEDRDAGLMP